VVLLAGAQHGVTVYSLFASRSKASVAGYGHADKRQMQLRFGRSCRWRRRRSLLTPADALAVALCHLQAEQARVRFAFRSQKAGKISVASPRTPCREQS